MRKKPASNGTIFENALVRTLDAYRSAGLCDLEKVEPPVKTFGSQKGRTVIFLKNPFLDFIGSWTERDGRLLVVECKSTETDTLTIGALDETALGKKVSASGIKMSQILSGHRWQRSGAAVCYLWNYHGSVKLVTPNMVSAQLTHRKSLRWCDAHPVPQGPGFILIDFLALLRRIHKQTPTS